MAFIMKKFLLISTLLAFTGMVRADAPIQLSLTPDIAIFPRTETVRGFSLGIWSENPQSSLTLGFINGSAEDSSGLTAGIVNYGENYQGVQWALVNVYSGNVVGWQASTMNMVQGSFEGFQSGIVNISQDVSGVQVGLVNYAESLRGFQLGVVNIAENNSWFNDFPDQLATGFPVLNWSF